MSTRVDDRSRARMQYVNSRARCGVQGPARPRGLNISRMCSKILSSGVVGRDCETRQLRNDISVAIPLPLVSGGLPDLP